ncbi:hypothetical protein Fmac_017048 [Flemingia macrophylla]|uniref:Uncharacterized protein n=1 Tax=Flemingia macrophylla TaxID=520843 RepID=A0ABD1M107_9FABA
MVSSHRKQIFKKGERYSKKQEEEEDENVTQRITPYNYEPELYENKDLQSATNCRGRMVGIVNNFHDSHSEMDSSKLDRETS